MLYTCIAFYIEINFYTNKYLLYGTNLSITRQKHLMNAKKVIDVLQNTLVIGNVSILKIEIYFIHSKIHKTRK